MPKHLAYVHKICELSKRGDIDAVADMMKGYFSDKDANPWHTIYKDIGKYWDKDYPKKDVTETLMLIRDSVFGGFELLSISIAVDIPTSNLIDLFTKESTWKDGRRKVRNSCIEHVEELIKKEKTRYLVPSALKHDGLGFLISGIEEADLETFRKAKPKMRKKSKKKQILDLRPLEKSKLGSRFLREQMIIEKQIEKGDPRIPSILESYDHFLIELEINRGSSIPEPIATEQVTLNGMPIEEERDRKEIPSRRPKEKVPQSPLTDFLEEKQIAKKNGSRKKSKKKRGRSKKK